MRHKPKQLTPPIPMLRPIVFALVIMAITSAVFLVSSNAGASAGQTGEPFTGAFTASYGNGSAVYIDTSGTPSGRLYGPFQVMDLGAAEQGRTLSVHSTLSSDQAPPTALYALATASVKQGEIITAFGDDQVRHATLIALADAGRDLNWVIEPGRYLLVFPRQVPPVGVYTAQSAGSFSYTISIK